MNAFKTSALVLSFALVSATSLLAQGSAPKVADQSMVATTATNYYAQPSLPDVNYPVQPVIANKRQTFATSLYRIKESMTMRLSIEKKFGDVVIVRLLDQDGRELHRESVSRRIAKYGCNFDFTKVEDGAYTIEIANGDEVQRKSISLGSVEVVKEPARTLVALN